MDDNIRRLMFEGGDQEYMMELGEWYRAYTSDDDEVIQPVLQSEADKFLIRQELSLPTDGKVDYEGLSDNIDKSTAGYWRFLDLVRRGNLDAIDRKAAIINGDGPADTFFAGFSARSGAAASIVQETKGISLKQLIDKYLRVRDLGEESRTHKDLIAAFRVLTSVVGENVQLDALNYDSFSEVFQLLKRLPTNFTKGNDRRGRSLMSIAEEAEKSGSKKLSAVSINKYMSRISAMMDWAVETEHASKNFANSKSLRAVRSFDENDKDAKDPFSVDELNSIRLIPEP